MAYNVHVKSMVPVDVDTLPTVDVDVINLPPVDVSVNSLPDMRITDIGPVGPVTLAGIPSNYTVGVTSLPDVNLRIREIPSLRVHIPANFRLGLTVMGIELAALHLCGEAQLITEPYVPNPCERCGTPRQSPQTSEVGAVLRLTRG
jgi:hypothetical protein